ncbi:MAG: PQQ-like beta-propeller repeat protein [Planctomycetes bacterium]|nr:PQQ-like beta-propeller repeat protein [Planctomycetota bacterium]
MNPRFTATLLGCLVWCSMLAPAPAASWSTYRGDATRSGHTAETLPAKLSLAWEHRADHSPQPAWPRSRRMQFDRAFHTVAADGSIYFGSSVDGTVIALDAKTGKPRWTFYTDAPVRFAPAIWKDRLFVASDDGYLYALATDDGKLLWKKRGGPNEAMVLGNQRMISKWPARGGPLVVGDVVYFAAGIWPSEGIYLYALEAATGKVRWVNDSSGGIYMAQPHGGANAKSGVSAQGYLVASAGKLFVPTGRAVPAAFDLKTGKFLYFHLQRYGHNGGEPTMAVGDMFFNSGLSFD